MSIPATAFKVSLYALSSLWSSYCVIKFLSQLSTSLLSLYFIYGLYYIKASIRVLKVQYAGHKHAHAPKELGLKNKKHELGSLVTLFLQNFYAILKCRKVNLLVIFKIKALTISGTTSSIEQWKLILLMHFSRNVSSILANLFSYDYCFMKQGTRINSASNKEEKQLHTLAKCIAWW